MAAGQIELYSDTKTRPTKGMRAAIATAEVGDEQHHEDPTVTRLLERVAPMLGQEAAMFMPAGTMANQVAVLMHCRQGDEIYGHELAHILNFEGGAPAALAGATTRTLPGARGIFTRAALRDALRPVNKYLPRSRLVVLEQTSNIAGGTVWTREEMQGVVDEARVHGLALHLDGARLFNACVASGRQPAEFAGLFDSVYLDFTKGLGAPLGAILAGSQAFIDEAWRWKQRLGGSMRQAGMMAAGCLYALDHHVERLQEDHDNARYLATSLAGVPGITTEPAETNIVFYDVGGTGFSAEEFGDRLRTRGLRSGVHGKTRLRFVTHLDVDKAQIDQAVEIVAAVAREGRQGF